jgi:uncharacterized cupin superfamily protein
MESAQAPYAVDRVAATSGYEPDIVDGKQVGEFRQLEPNVGSDNELDASIWRSEPATYEYEFATDEAFHVIEGAVSIELPETGETIELETGDVAYFRAGTKSVWNITEAFKKFVVMPG